MSRSIQTLKLIDIAVEISMQRKMITISCEWRLNSVNNVSVLFFLFFVRFHCESFELNGAKLLDYKHIPDICWVMNGVFRIVENSFGGDFTRRMLYVIVWIGFQTFIAAHMVWYLPNSDFPIAKKGWFLVDLTFCKMCWRNDLSYE